MKPKNRTKQFSSGGGTMVAELPERAEDGKTRLGENGIQPVPAFDTSLKERIARAPESRVPRELIRIGGTNPRQHFDLADLLPDIQEHGIIAALWVRLLPQWELTEPDMLSDKWRLRPIGSPLSYEPLEFAQENLAHMELTTRNEFRYELIAGERRFRAAAELALVEVPVKIIECTPAEAWKLQRIENLKRKDLTPLEEAQDFRTAVDSGQWGQTVDKSVKALAEELQCSWQHIYDRMALLKLSDASREAFISGAVELCLAKEISAVPGEKAQKELLNLHLASPFSVRTIRAHIEDKFLQPLSGAPFDTSDAQLVTVCGSCRDCEFRAGNMLETFPHLKTMADTCTRPEFYKAKVDAHREKLLTKFSDEGHRVLTAKESKPLFHGTYLVQGGWALAGSAASQHYDKQERTWKQLAKLVKEKTIAACDGTGAVVELFETGALLEKLYAAKILKKSKTSERENGQGGLGIEVAPKRITEEDRFKEALDRAVEMNMTERTVAALVDKAESSMPVKNDRLKEILCWQIFCLDNMHLDWSPIYRRRNWPEDKTIGNIFEPMEAHEVLGVLFETSLLNFENDYNGEQIEEACTKFKVDGAKIEKEVRAELKALWKLPKDGELFEVSEEFLRSLQDHVNTQRIAENGACFQPFDFRGYRWLCTSGGGNSQAWRVLDPEDFEGKPGTYAELVNHENGYHGVQVSCRGITHVLSRPEINFRLKPPEPASTPSPKSKPAKAAKAGKGGKRGKGK